MRLGPTRVSGFGLQPSCFRGGGETAVAAEAACELCSTAVLALAMSGCREGAGEGSGLCSLSSWLQGSKVVQAFGV